jgi:Icc-related predicted phosphoesterase
MKILYVVDVHGNEEAVEWIKKKANDYDFLIVGGDLCTFSDVQFMEKFFNSISKTWEKVFFVPGNNDTPDPETPFNIINIHGRKETLGSIEIGGLGGSNITPFRTRFEMSDSQARNILDTLGRVEVLVSHCPPSGTKCDVYSGKHLGSIPVREYVERNKPAIVLTGHVHESKAVDKVGDTTVVNPGPMLSGNYAEITLGSIYVVELKRANL